MSKEMLLDLDFNNTNPSSIKTLSLLFLLKTDNFCVDSVQLISKRTATSGLAKLFEPLGVLAPEVGKAEICSQ